MSAHILEAAFCWERPGTRRGRPANLRGGQRQRRRCRGALRLQGYREVPNRLHTRCPLGNAISTLKEKPGGWIYQHLSDCRGQSNSCCSICRPVKQTNVSQGDQYDSPCLISLDDRGRLARAAALKEPTDRQAPAGCSAAACRAPRQAQKPRAPAPSRRQSAGP